MNEKSKIPTVRAAIYMRSAADYKSRSLKDQERQCRAAAANREPAWSIADEHVFTDSDASGPSPDRTGLKLLLEKAAEGNRPLDLVVTQNIRTLDLRFSVVLDIVEALGRRGIGVYFVDEMLDTRDDFFVALVGLTRKWCLPRPKDL